jgi:hypothetical protein
MGMLHTHDGRIKKRESLYSQKAKLQEYFIKKNYLTLNKNYYDCSNQTDNSCARSFSNGPWSCCNTCTGLRK